MRSLSDFPTIRPDDSTKHRTRYILESWSPGRESWTETGRRYCSIEEALLYLSRLKQQGYLNSHNKFRILKEETLLTTSVTGHQEFGFDEI